MLVNLLIGLQPLISEGERRVTPAGYHTHTQVYNRVCVCECVSCLISISKSNKLFSKKNHSYKVYTQSYINHDFKVGALHGRSFDPFWFDSRPKQTECIETQRFIEQM